MDPFVLIHGAWIGAWCWEPMIGELERRQRRAFAPQLPGFDGSSANLNDQIEEIVRFISRHDLSDIVFVAVNASAALMPLVCEAIPRLIDGVLFVDGLIPLPGESIVDVAESVLPGAREKWAASVDDRGMLPPDTTLLDWMLADVPEPRRSEALEHARPVPYAAVTTPIHYSRFPDAPPYRAYIRCQRTPLANTGARMAERARAPLYPLAAAHHAMLSHPGLLADRILEIVATWNSGDAP